jgi:hypothetical protein
MKFGIPKLTQIYESNHHSFKNYIWVEQYRKETLYAPG